MPVLIDELFPVELADELRNFAPRTVHQERLKGLRNSDLLAAAAERGFSVILTGDISMRFQQNLSKYRIGVVVLHAPSNRIGDLIPRFVKLFTR